MKKFLLIILCFVFIISPSLIFASGDIGLFLNNEEIVSDVKPFIEKGRTLVPVRVISESLGYNVEWVQEKSLVVVSSAINKIEMTIDSKEAFVNGEKVELDVPAQLKNSRTFVPIRFISENLGLIVNWDQENNRVLLSTEELPIISLVETEKKVESSKTYDGLKESPYPDRLIKGNINNKGEKIFHVPGQMAYNKTVIDESEGERWFATAEEARNAGWRQAQR